jgi:hypothetical protein
MKSWLDEKLPPYLKFTTPNAFFWRGEWFPISTVLNPEQP